MPKVSDIILSTSPKKLAIYLVLGPLVLILANTIIAIILRNTSSAHATMIFGVYTPLTLFLAAFILLWLFWLRNSVYSVNETQLGLSRKWFQIAYAFLWFFIIFNVAASVIETLFEKRSNSLVYLIYAPREFINFGGIILAYPIVCHYAARATVARRSAVQSTFVNSIPFTLLLLFGTVLGIPFLHKYFSTKTSTKAEILVIYAIAFGLFLTTFIIGFIAAITGMV